MQENLQEMIKSLNVNAEVINSTIVDEIKDPTECKVDPTDVKPEENSANEIKLISFYDWFQANEKSVEDMGNIHRVQSIVANIDSKDSMIFKIKKGKTEDKELVSFYNPSLRPILNLPPVYVKIFKNDTFEVLHVYNDEIFIKSYGVKTGLIIVYCANVDGKIVPFERTKVKKNATTIPLKDYSNVVKEIKDRLAEAVDVESIQLLYKQAIKSKDEFTTKESALDWFIKRQIEVIDINHLLKIDSVLINVI